MKWWLRNTGHAVNANYTANGCEVKKTVIRFVFDKSTLSGEKTMMICVSVFGVCFEWIINLNRAPEKKTVQKKRCVYYAN